MDQMDIGEVVNNLQAIAAEFPEKAEKGLGEWAEYVLGEAVNLVPIEEGTLQNSGTTAVSGDTAAVGFGLGAAAPYAARQHEDMTYRHDAGRQAKYLEIPLVASKEAGLEIMQRALEL